MMRNGSGHPSRGAHNLIIPSTPTASAVDGAVARVDSALELAAHGLAVLPLIGKRPAPKLAPKGVYSATTRPETIRDWFAPDSWLNIGIAVPRGVVVLDLDPRNSRYQTVADMHRALCDDLGPLPETATALTGGGGLHLWFAYPDGIERITPRPEFANRGVDVQQVGKYVVAPPSAHPDTGRAYQWHRTGIIAQLPSQALEALKRPLVAGKPATTPTRHFTGNSRASYGGLINSYLRRARPGNRNNLLSNAARKFALEGQPQEAFDALTKAAMDVGLPPKEIAATIASAQNYVRGVL